MPIAVFGAVGCLRPISLRVVLRGYVLVEERRYSLLRHLARRRDGDVTLVLLSEAVLFEFVPRSTARVLHNVC